MGVTWVCCSCSMSGRGRPEKYRTTKLRKPCTLPLCSASPWWNLWIHTVESKNVQLLPKTAISNPTDNDPLCGHLNVVRFIYLFICLLFYTSFLTYQRHLDVPDSAAGIIMRSGGEWRSWQEVKHMLGHPQNLSATTVTTANADSFCQKK